ncbi:MAG: LysR substrate-binding domain-containing protein [Candidatus Competibacteraceae bacterium]|nr:LysR substrate-binding domain-containing protein [Candidatus Competibacteraceae bacterium]
MQPSHLPDIKLNQLRHFVSVVEQKGFHAAARKCFRSQPAISLSIQDLEEKLGGALFEKHSKAEPTALGRLFYPLAKDLILHYDRMLREVLLITQLQAGRVSIAAVPSVAERLLPAVIKEYVQRYPDIRVQVQDDNAENVQRKVLSGEVDLGIASRCEEDARLAFVELFRDRMGVACHREHPLSEARTLTWKMLEGHTLIANGTVRLLNGTPAEAIWADAHLTIYNTTSLIAMLEANIGVTALPSLAFPQGRANVVFKATGEPAVERCIGLMTQRRYTGTPAAQAMAALITERLGR